MLFELERNERDPILTHDPPNDPILLVERIMQ